MTFAAMAAKPSAAAFADAPNQTLTDWVPFYDDGTIAGRKAKAQAAIAAGYTLMVFDPPNHMLCAWGYNDSGLIGLDSRSQNASPYWRAWGNCMPSSIIRGVRFANAVMGPPLTTPLPQPKVIVPLPPAPAPAPVPVPVPIPSGNTKMWNIVEPDLTEHIDAGGTKWQARDWNNGSMALLRNGSYGGITPSEVYYPGTDVLVYLKRGADWWMKGTGAGSIPWVYMAIGEVPPGYGSAAPPAPAPAPAPAPVPVPVPPGTTATGGFVSGDGAVAVSGSAAIGRGAQALGADSLAVGQGAHVKGDNGVAIGWVAVSSANQGRAIGYQANDRGIDGYEGYSHGSFQNLRTQNFELPGVADAQRGRAVLRVLTNNATPTPLTTDGGGPGFNNQIKLQDKSSYVLEWLVIARDISSGDSQAWKLLVMATRGAGAASTNVSLPVVTNIASSSGVAGWGVALTADTYNGAVQLNGIGQAGKSIQWVAAMVSGENVG
jgi:hypothetical protein